MGDIMKTVVVGMSGGVDSSVAALLLKQQGYQVIGLFMRNWDSTINNDVLGNPHLHDFICPQEQDYNDAASVCAKLKIKLQRVDFVKEYWDYVFTYFLTELKKGRTPNPDIMCNKYIKFDLFIKEAKRLGADFVATGHYARLVDGKLYRALDKNKDQTYFLSQLSKKQLQDVLFPIGDLTKQEVRRFAAENNLITATKKGSTGICFIGERKFTNFLRNYLPIKPGPIVNLTTKETIGKHQGLMNYTIGQRRGLNVGGQQEKLFVVGKDLKQNILYVALGDKNEFLYSDAAIIENVNWLGNHKPKQCLAQFRYRQSPQAVTLEYLTNDTIKVLYPQKIKAVTPGQACVFYAEDECLGGGIIKEALFNNQRRHFL
ncbi:MAG: tRNA 2-thiouridine(34) synthase MnmA [Bacilli bacterium]